MQECCNDSDLAMMVVLGLENTIIEEEIKLYQDKIYIANYNCRGQCVLAGYKESLINIAVRFRELVAKRTIILEMSVVSHCPFLEPMSQDFRFILEANLNDYFKYPIIANINAQSYQDKASAIKNLQDQLVKPVQYEMSIKNIEDQVDYFIEFGPSSVLKGINRKLTKKPTFSITDMRSLEKTISDLKKLAHKG